MNYSATAECDDWWDIRIVAVCFPCVYLQSESVGDSSTRAQSALGQNDTGVILRQKQISTSYSVDAGVVGYKKIMFELQTWFFFFIEQGVTVYFSQSMMLSKATARMR